MSITTSVAAAVGAALGSGVGAVAGFFIADKVKAKNKMPVALGVTALGGTLGALLISGIGDSCPPSKTGATNPLAPNPPPRGIP